MPQTLSLTFTCGTFAPDFNPQTRQEDANEMARLWQATIELPSGTFVNTPTPPTSDLGPWIPPGEKQEIWFWDSAFGAYYPGGVPPGTIIESASATVPINYLLCDTSAKSQAAYPRLYAAIGQQFNLGDEAALLASGQFRVPDHRGRCAIGTTEVLPNVDPNQTISAGTLGLKTGVERTSLQPNQTPPGAGIGILRTKLYDPAAAVGDLAPVSSTTHGASDQNFPVYGNPGDAGQSPLDLRQPAISMRFYIKCR